MKGSPPPPKPFNRLHPGITKNSILYQDRSTREGKLGCLECLRLVWPEAPPGRVLVSTPPCAFTRKLKLITRTFHLKYILVHNMQRREKLIQNIPWKWVDPNFQPIPRLQNCWNIATLSSLTASLTLHHDSHEALWTEINMKSYGAFSHFNWSSS